MHRTFARDFDCSAHVNVLRALLQQGPEEVLVLA